MIKESLVGKKFGRLLVIKEEDFKDKKDYVYVCKCDCGNEKSISARHLRSGGTKSCGCLAQETISKNGKLHKLENRDAVLIKGLFAKFKNEAKHKNKTFSITLDQFSIYSKNNCFYCGASPKNIFTYSYSNEKILYNGIDRINSDLNYDVNNIVSCCWRCNSAKNNMSIFEFCEWLNNIMNIFGKSETFVELTNEMKKNI